MAKDLANDFLPTGTMKKCGFRAGKHKRIPTPGHFRIARLHALDRSLLYLNPLTPVIEQTRQVLYWGKAPDWPMLGVYIAASLLLAWLGFAWFQKTRKGFADVL